MAGSTEHTSFAAFPVLTAPQQIAAGIKRQILDGVLKPGDRLPSEHELAKLFGVSRPTARAGLQELCAAQVLVVARGRNGGYRVGDFSLAQLETNVTEFISLSLVLETLKPEHFHEVRCAHELLCAETAAQRRTPETLERLEAVRAEIVASSDDARRAFESDLRFHRVLAEATQNPLVVSIEAAMIAVLRRLIGDSAATTPDETLANLGQIIDAVRDGAPDAARDAMRRHLVPSALHYGLDADGVPLTAAPATLA